MYFYEVNKAIASLFCRFYGGGLIMNKNQTMLKKQNMWNHHWSIKNVYRTG